jgi:hypothetical protein
MENTKGMHDFMERASDSCETLKGFQIRGLKGDNLRATKSSNV